MKKTLIVLLMITLTACGGSHVLAPIDDKRYNRGKQKPSISTIIPTSLPLTYKVKKGDTLYSISWRYGMNYQDLAENNNIRSPYKIYPGQTLKIRPQKQIRKKRASVSREPTTTRALPKERITFWHWPTEGKIISTYSVSGAGRKGIDIAGISGQGIVSAASGEVVYSGNGLPRYGRLLIIKHNNVYLSAYAHNKTLLVKEGEQVKAGQKIATLGRTGTQQDKLHFEIRRNGKPVDPLKLLPKR